MMVLAWFGIASPPFQHAASLLAYRCSRNLSYEVSEDEHLQLLSGEGILYNKVARKRKKCNKTNSVEFKSEGFLPESLFSPYLEVFNKLISWANGAEQVTRAILNTREERQGFLWLLFVLMVLDHSELIFQHLEVVF